MDKEAFRKIRRIQIQTIRDVNDLFAGDYRSLFKGRGIEFEEVREYLVGDDVRNIDWNVTARSSTAYIKQFREERELTVILLVDISASTRFSHTPQLKSQLIAEIGALIAFSAIKNQDKVGLLLFSDRVELFLRPRKDLKHLLRVIHEILFFKPVGRGTDLRQALAFVGRLQKRRAICFLLSDFISPSTQGFEREAALLAQRHELIALQIYDAYERTLPSIGLLSLQDLETGADYFLDTEDKTTQATYSEERKREQEAVKKLFNKINVSLLAIPTKGSYLQLLHYFFRNRKRLH